MREPVNSSHGQLVTPIFLWRVDGCVFRVVWRVDRSVLGGWGWRVDCRYSSHEWVCLLTYGPKYHCWRSLSHLQSIFMLFLLRYYTMRACLLNSSEPKSVWRLLLPSNFLLLLLLLLLWICFYCVALTIVVSRLVDLIHARTGFQQTVHSHKIVFWHLI